MTGNRPQADQVLLCVGNCLMGDDGAGPRLAEICLQQPLAHWTVIDGGVSPENDIYAIREHRPRRLVIVDATDMGLAPGELRIVDEKDIAEMFFVTTHSMPLTFLMQQLEDDIDEITFIGIQPEVVAFYYPMSEAVEQAIHQLYALLAADDIARCISPYLPNIQPTGVCDE